MQLGFSAFRQNLLGHPTPANLLALFLPPVPFVLGILLTAARRLRVRVPAEPASLA